MPVIVLDQPPERLCRPLDKGDVLALGIGRSDLSAKHLGHQAANLIAAHHGQRHAR